MVLSPVGPVSEGQEGQEAACGGLCLIMGLDKGEASDLHLQAWVPEAGRPWLSR